MVEHFFAASLDFVKRGLLPSGGIVDKGYLWETWEDTPYTPRNGYPVEIELPWLTALRDYLPVVQDRTPELAGRLQATLQEGQETFKLFELDGYLADSLTYDFEPRLILTPNGYLAFEVGYPLPPALKRRMVILAREQLAGHTGVRSLAPRDWAGTFSREFMADEKNVHHGRIASVGLYNYHRGVEWLWLNQFLVAGDLQCGDAQHAYWTYVSGRVRSALHEMGVGGLSELYDIRGPLGADFQAWSMAGFIACLHAFAGVQVDAIARFVSIRPAIPDLWPSLTCRRAVGATCFEVRYRHGSSGQQIVEVHAIDPVSAGTSLRVGVRIPAGTRAVNIAVNGQAVPTERVQRMDACAPDVDGEAWIETDLRQQVIAEFRASS